YYLLRHVIFIKLILSLYYVGILTFRTKIQSCNLKFSASVSVCRLFCIRVKFVYMEIKLAQNILFLNGADHSSNCCLFIL
ncbi:hypothetical protein L9F63_005933, partial [Diploptera punctata]